VGPVLAKGFAIHALVAVQRDRSSRAIRTFHRLTVDIHLLTRSLDRYSEREAKRRSQEAVVSSL
jgi:hypothetical protein